MKYIIVQGDRCIQCIRFGIIRVHSSLLESVPPLLAFAATWSSTLDYSLAHSSIYISDKITRTYLQSCKSPQQLYWLFLDFQEVGNHVEQQALG